MTRTKRNHLAVIRCSKVGAALCAVSTILLSTALPVAAGKGGKPGGGGGEDPPAVELVPAPVEYRVTWINPGANQPVTDLWDVNAAGVAVGYYYPDLNATGYYAAARGFMADADGNQWNLDHYFAAALQTDYPGWRLGFGTEINKAGQIACLLVPDDWHEGNKAPAIVIALGNIYAETPSLITVEEFPTGFIGWGVEDLNEEGDVLLKIDGLLYLHHFPFTAPPTQMPIPTGTELLVRTGDLNSYGEVIFSARATTTTTSIRGKKTVTSTTTSENIYSWGTDGSLQMLEEGISSVTVGLSDTGNAYATVNGVAQVRSPDTGVWQPIAPSGQVEQISKAIPGEDLVGEEVVIWSGSGTVHFVHQSGYGTFPLVVTSGLNGGQDVTAWNEQLETTYGYPHFVGISRSNYSGSGYLSGTAWIQQPDGSTTYSEFILTPATP